MSWPTLSEMLEDLQTLVNKGYGDKSIDIYCVNCDCNDGYRGATLGKDSIQITINSGLDK